MRRLSERQRHVLRLLSDGHGAMDDIYSFDGTRRRGRRTVLANLRSLGLVYRNKRLMHRISAAGRRALAAL